MENLGQLYIVSTPIGNMGDFSFRAVEILKMVDLIACEDTRVSGRLLKHYGIKNNLTSFFEHNEDYKLDLIIKELSFGKNVALISDSGTPLISDPGFKLVRKIRELGFNVTACPGATSVITSLSISGFPTDKFFFGGFLPTKQGKKERVLLDYMKIGCTLIFFESPHRIIFTVQTLVDMGIKNDICVCRELTKKYEEVLIGSASEVLEKLSDKDAVKGEFVLLIKALNDDEADEKSVEDYEPEIVELFAEGKTSKDIVGYLVDKYELNKKEVFNFVQEIKKLVN